MTSLSVAPSEPSLIPVAPSDQDSTLDLVALRDSDTGKRLVAWVHGEYQKCKTARNREEQRWYRNLALYGNDPDSEFNSQGRLVTLPQPRNKKKLRINRVKPAIRTEIARMIAQKPTISAIPATNEDEDSASANAADAALQSVMRRRKFWDIYAEAAFWTSITGTGFVKTYWDPNAEDKEARMLGDILFSAVDPFHLFIPDLRAKYIEDQPYVLNMYTRSIDWLEYFFKDELAGIKLTPSVVSANTLMEEAYVGLTGSDSSKPDSCIVYEMWIKPGGCKYLPNGGLLTVVDNYIVGYIDTGLPYTHGMYPFVKFSHIPTARFYGDSIIPDIEPLQLDYNDLRTQIAETRRLMGKVQIIAPKGSISATKMTNQTGLVIEYRPGMAPPQPLPLAQLPNYMLQEQDRILLDIEDITGQHQVSKGNTPPGVTAATAISFLQEKDDSLMSPTHKSIESGIEDIGKQIIGLAIQYWDTQRLVRTVGEDKVVDAQVLTGVDLVNGTDIRIEPGSSLPESKAARQAFIMDLMNQGHIQSQEGLEILEVGGAQKLIDNLQVDKRQAMRENILLKRLTPQDFAMFDQAWQEAAAMGDPQTVDPNTGQPLVQPPIIPVNTWDNHEVHIEIHNRFRKTQGFALLPLEVKEAFEAHVQMHKSALMQNQLEQMLGQIPSDGTDSFGFDPQQGGTGSDMMQGTEQPQDAPAQPDTQQEQPLGEFGG